MRALVKKKLFLISLPMPAHSGGTALMTPEMFKLKASFSGVKVITSRGYAAVAIYAGMAYPYTYTYTKVWFCIKGKKEEKFYRCVFETFR